MAEMRQNPGYQADERVANVDPPMDAPQEPEESYDDGFDADETEPPPLSPEARRRMMLAIALIVALGLAAVLPPLINVNRFRRRIATSISASLGRPVHLDSVALNLLPLPGFVLTNFSVDEDPTFGSEPVIRANTVRATLRIRSLWHREVEFSKISLDDPSVNLVHREDGRWNIESILLQASRLKVVPTEQRPASDAPRFPYIEATGARVNLKRGLEKMPLSFTDAAFALWLPKPEVWQLRLEAHPNRTDTAATDTGLLKLEGTLGKADLLENVPVKMTGEWSGAPMGAASRIVMGRDAGLRGDLTLRASLNGTFGTAALDSKLELRRLRRADFVPAEPLSVDLDCTANTLHVLHSIQDLHCIWPNAGGDGGLQVTGEIPDARQPRSADLVAKWTRVPLSAILDFMHAASDRISPDLGTGGAFSGEFDCCVGGLVKSSGSLEATHFRLSAGTGKPIVADQDVQGDLDGGALSIAPLGLDLGAPQPALLAVRADESGVKMRLTGNVVRARLLALGTALPQFGEGLISALPDAAKPPGAPLHVDLAATRTWGGAQTWVPAAPAVNKRRRR